MRPEAAREMFERKFRESRSTAAALLDRACSMLPADSTTRAAIDDYKRSATLDEYRPPAPAAAAVALDRLEVAGEHHKLSGEFWHILKHVAVTEALYERAARYRDRAAAEGRHN